MPMEATIFPFPTLRFPGPVPTLYKTPIRPLGAEDEDVNVKQRRDDVERVKDSHDEVVDFILYSCVHDCVHICVQNIK
jgi:hypothetical protein